MKVTKQTPTKEITISGLKFSIPQPYAEGHPLNENEAMALNQTLAENLRNNFASQIRKAKDQEEKAGREYKPDQKALQKELDSYVTEYEFGVRRQAASTAHLDPVDREVAKLARNAVKAAIQEKGIKIRDVPKERLETLVEQYQTQNYETLHKHASVIVESRNAVSSALGDDISV